MTNPKTAAPTTTMRAVVQDRYGSSEVLRIAEVARPAISAHEVLVQVRAAGLDRGTEHLMTGKPYAVVSSWGCVGPGTRCPGATSPGRWSRPAPR